MGVQVKPTFWLPLGMTIFAVVMIAVIEEADIIMAVNEQGDIAFGLAK